MKLMVYELNYLPKDAEGIIEKLKSLLITPISKRKHKFKLNSKPKMIF